MRDVGGQPDAHHELRRVEAELRSRIRLDGIVTSFSTRFLGLPANELSSTVREALRDLCLANGYDRAYVLKSNEQLSIELFVEWWRDDVEPVSTPISALPVDAQRFWVGVLLRGEMVNLPTLDEAPARAGAAVAALRHDGVRSILFLPLHARDTIVGFMGLEARRAECTFPDDTVDLMRTVGELFVSAAERARAETALAETAQQLEERNRDLERSNRDLEQFASIVSHDLKSPLQVVRGFVELLGRHLAANPTAGEDVSTYVNAALRGAGRMERLIDDLLAYARAGQRPQTFALIDLNAVVDEVLADSAALIADTNAHVRADRLPTLAGDVTQLRQLLQNLVTNAIKFTRPGENPDVVISADDAGDEWIITIADNGIGIPSDKRGEIFGMFTRLAAKADTTGSGIGLAVCARVAENHRGRIWVEENAGGGCRFRFSLAKNLQGSR